MSRLSERHTDERTMPNPSPPALICGIPVSSASILEVLRNMSATIQAKQPRGYISITNTESMYHALRRPEHFRYIKGADYSLCDGVGVIAAGYAWGHRVRRLNGPVLQLECSRYGVELGWRHYFYGGKDGVAERMAKNLRTLFPGMITAGIYCPPFRDLSPEEDADVVQRINEAKPDILWVGLGLLKQERWIADHLDKIQVPWMVGVGAAFDYHSGAVPWAPKWIRSLGLEWLFRLIIQPRLRAKRYWWSLVFVIEAVSLGLAQRATGAVKRIWWRRGKLSLSVANDHKNRTD